MMLIVPQVAPSCVCIPEVHVAIVPHFTPDASHATSSLFPGREIRTEEWHHATTHSNITPEPEAVWQHSKRVLHNISYLLYSALQVLEMIVG